MTRLEALDQLKTYEQTGFALHHAMGILYYDGDTIAPRGSAAVRASTLGQLSRLDYELTTAPATVDMIMTLRDCQAELDPVTARKVSELYWDYDRTRRIPKEEYVAWQELTSQAGAVWHEAKVQNDYASFEPYLSRLVEGSRKMAGWTDPGKDPYEALLDQYERGLTVEACEDFFARLRQDLVPLIHQVTEYGDRVDNSPLRQSFPVAVQREFSEYLMDLLGLDRDHCILGETEHPFTTGFSKNDVRITTHYHEDMVDSSLYSVVHEGGHALYELHIGDDLQFSNLADGASMAIHESQSRFFENIIGRSREFCGLMLPWLKEHFPGRLDGVDDEQFYRMINKAEPSLIRTQADELTYSLHIMVRFRLEKALLAGELSTRDLPGAWNELYREYLGLTVPTDREGVLQDSHWSMGSFGYFPSYALGSAYGAQFLQEMEKSFDVFAAVKTGDLSPVRNWLEDKLWRHGRMMDPGDLFRSVCGDFDPGCYTKYLTKKYSEIYGL